MTQAKEGGCLCGAVRFRADGVPSYVNVCHCRMCQKASGAPMMAWATFERTNVEVTGMPMFRISSPRIERGFCGDCGSTLIWRRCRSETLDLAVGTFDDPSTLKPSEHIWTESRARWLNPTDHLPRYRRRSGPGAEKEF